MVRLVKTSVSVQETFDFLVQSLHYVFMIGQLPPRTPTAAPNSSYSTKIFLGGVPWDISEQSLVQAFSEFGDVRVEWPGRDYTSPPKGYLYLVFEL